MFQVALADFFTFAGNSYLVYADRLSGWLEVAQVSSTAHSTIRALSTWFVRLGVPLRLRTDGGAPFTGFDFQQLLHRWGVEHVRSSPHYPQSNGHTEAAVKSIKRLLQKTSPAGDLNCEAFLSGLLELRNTPGVAGRSPAELLFGNNLRSRLPAHHSSFATEWTKAADRLNQHVANRRRQAIATYDRSDKPLTPLTLHSEVRIQDPRTYIWDQCGTIVSIGAHHTYRVKLPSGRVYWCNRRFLCPLPAPSADSDMTSDSQSTQLLTSDAESPRRSTRHCQRPQRYGL